jgi:hypothetical protein
VLLLLPPQLASAIEVAAIAVRRPRWRSSFIAAP